MKHIATNQSQPKSRIGQAVLIDVLGTLIKSTLLFFLTSSFFFSQSFADPTALEREAWDIRHFTDIRDGFNPNDFLLVVKAYSFPRLGDPETTIGKLLDSPEIVSGSVISPSRQDVWAYNGVVLLVPKENAVAAYSQDRGYFGGENQPIGLQGLSEEELKDHLDRFFSAGEALRGAVESGDPDYVRYREDYAELYYIQTGLRPPHEILSDDLSEGHTEYVFIPKLENSGVILLGSFSSMTELNAPDYRMHEKAIPLYEYTKSLGLPHLILNPHGLDNNRPASLGDCRGILGSGITIK